MGEITQVTTTSIILTLWRERKKIIANFIIASILAAGFSLMLPEWYRSSVTLLPASAIGGDLFVLGGGGGALNFLGFSQGNDELNKYISILNSRQVLESVAREFDLKTVYDLKSVVGAAHKLSKNIDINISEEGAFIFSVLDRDSVRARDIALTLLQQLGDISSGASSQAGHRNRHFIQARIDSVEAELLIIEQKLYELNAKYSALEYSRLERRAAILGAILQAIYPQYEQASLQESRDEALYHVLDYPHIPRAKYKPKRSLIVLSVAFFSVLVTCLWIIIKPQWLAMVAREADYQAG
ncbi:MAG: hypothetical protein KAU50_05620 [Candidatus Marinimicrobia bacterium]|nr:hypothetical protein [Candidatus Neomarinimicrobiota bacterium]